jgi:hypothetical protein
MGCCLFIKTEAAIEPPKWYPHENSKLAKILPSWDLTQQSVPDFSNLGSSHQQAPPLILKLFTDLMRVVCPVEIETSFQVGVLVVLVLALWPGVQSIVVRF